MKRSMQELRRMAERRRERQFLGSAKFKLQQWLAVETMIRCLRSPERDTPGTLAWEMYRSPAALTTVNAALVEIGQQRWPRHVIRYAER